MVDEDACAAVKSDLQAGTFTITTYTPPIYIIGKDEYQGGNVRIHLKDATREFEQLVNGPILYTKRGCTILIIASSAAIRDDVFNDVVNILVATSRGYKLKRGKDNHHNRNLNGLPLEVSMIL